MKEREPQKTKQEQIHNKFRSFSELIDSGGELYATDLTGALRHGELTEDQFRELVDKLILRSQESAKFQNQHGIDVTTGLLDRVHLKPKLEGLIREMSFSPEKRHAPLHFVMVVALDMDRLKFLNDHYSHAVGDRALKALADHLQKVTHRRDILFRPAGGDEFIVLLPIENDTADPEKLFERIKSEVNDDLFIDIEEKNGSITRFQVTAAMGYSVLKRGDIKTAEELLKEADQMEREDKKTKKAGEKKD